MPKKILIIDDDPVVLKYLESLLTDNGYQVFKASNGVEGSKMVAKVKPDLITLDLEMPEQWGPRFYRRMVKDKETKDIPVIVISGLTGSQYSLPKAAAHLSKPFEPDQLLKLVRDQIGQP
jgi:CheY-like chemotaxis protein